MNESEISGTILVVDDIESIRFAIAEYLANDFRVIEASDGFEATSICENEKVDLVISDIRMPGMGGLQLIRLLTPKYPEMQFALMTAYNVDDYIEFVRNENIWNIIPKSTFLDLKYILVMARKLLGNNIFGIHHYFPEIGYEDVSLSTLHRMHRNPDETPLMPDVFYTCHVTTVEENNVICDMIGEVLHRAGAPSVIRMVIEELAANAMLHAPGRTREEREAMQQQARKSGPVPVDHPAMAEEDAFQISFGLLSGQAVIAVTDFHGTLDRDEVLYRLERQVTVDGDNNLPVGLTDFHGRGLYISREQVDHLIFNIAPDRKTEIIGILPLDSNVRSRAISIFQKK